MNRIPALAIGLGLSLGSVAGAQPARALAQRDDALVLQVMGPAAMRVAFLPTNLGSLLAAREATDFWTVLGAPLSRAMGRIADVEPDPLFEALMGYGGRITLAVDPQDDRMTSFAGALILAPDRRTDLEALAAGMRDWLGKSRWTATKLRCGDTDITGYVVAGNAGFTAPTVRDGHLVVAFGTDLAEDAPRRWALPAETAFEPDAELARSPIGLRIDLAGLLDRGLPWGWFGDDESSRRAARALGMYSLDEARLLVRPSGPRVEIETSVRFRDGPRGLFAGLMPDSQEPPSLLHLVPEEHRDWSASKFDVGAVFDAILAVIEAEEGADPLEEHEEPRHFADLFAAMTSHYAQLGSMIPKDTRRYLGEFCIAFRLKDAAKFEDALAKLRESLSSFIGAPDERDGVTRWSLNLFITRMVLVRTGDLMLLSHDFGDSRWLDAMLERAVAAKPDAGQALPAAIRPLRTNAPPGLHGCGRMDVRDLLRAVPGAGLFLHDVVEEDLLGEVADRLVPLLEKYELESAHVLTGYAEQRWRSRILW